MPPMAMSSLFFVRGESFSASRPLDPEHEPRGRTDLLQLRHGVLSRYSSGTQTGLYRTARNTKGPGKENLSKKCPR